ncbi:MAG: ATP synthase subunit I [Rubrivivax sp.]
MSGSRIHSGAWDDGEEAEAAPPLTRQQAQAYRDRHPQVPVWWVVAAQAAVGALIAMLAWVISGDRAVLGSALYGAAVAVVPGALMARGMSSRVSSMSPSAGAVSFMWWEMVKIAVSVLMLMLAPKIVQPLSWPALLASLVVCLNVYLLALLWRRSAKK